MGQKINPIALRLGIIRGWDSNWYGGKDYGDRLVEDEKIRKYILARIPKGGISKIIIVFQKTKKKLKLAGKKLGKLIFVFRVIIKKITKDLNKIRIG